MQRIENFNLNRIKDMSPNDAKAYIDNYFYILADGKHAFYNYDKKDYDIYDIATIRSTYFKRMSSELNNYYFTEKTDLRTITYDINKPELFDNYLNLCPRIKHTYKPYIEFDDNIKELVNRMLDHIKNVLCSSNESTFQFLLKWFSNMTRGNRNDSCIYLKGPMGAGKSTPMEFIREHVIGNDLCTQCGSGPLKTKFNGELSGKLMVMFEELESFNTNEWMAVSSVLRRQITSKTIMIEKKGLDSREETNINNYILLSNNDAIQDDDGRRYFILDICTKFIGEYDYFNKLYECFNDEVGHAFYCYLLEVDLTGYNAQRYPTTQSKLDAFAKRLDIISKFLKHEYVLKRKPIDRVLVGNFYEHYCGYCRTLAIKPKNKIDFNKSLKDLGIEYKKSNGNNYYTVSIDELNKLATKFKWVHELDEYENDEPSLDASVETTSDEVVEIDYEQLYKAQLAKVKELESKINELKQNRIVLKNIEIGELLDDVKQMKPIKTYTKIVKQPISNDDNEFCDDIMLFKKIKNN